MKCAICGIEIDDIEEAVDQGWVPYFYENETEHSQACPECTKALLQIDQNGEMEVKPEFHGKVKYTEAIPDKVGEHVIGIALFDPNNNCPRMN